MSAECTSGHCDWHGTVFAHIEVCRTCGNLRPIDESPPAQPLSADTGPRGWDAGYETLKVLPGDVLTAREYLARCKEIPAQPASTLDTSPPSRTSNAASANGAASLLALIGSVDKYFSITNRTHPQVEITLPEWQLIKSALQQRIEVSGVEGHARSCKPSEAYLPIGSGPVGYVRMAEGTQITGAGIKPGLTSSLPIAALPEPAIRAAVYDCTDAQCVCGRCGPIKIAVDCSIERVLKS